jgi:pimeloyl-ACP methyl ester carboxylesterase
MMAAVETTIFRAYTTTPGGQIHYVECGAGQPVILLHQSPRSWREFEFVLPLVGTEFRAIAMDTLGFGDSYRSQRQYSVELFAGGVIDLMDSLQIERASLVGHHTGGVVAVEVAAFAPERVNRLVLSCMPYVGPAEREMRKTRPPIDLVEPKLDGSHLQELWNRRSSYYPAGRPDLLARFVADAVRVMDRIEDGHSACSVYHMEERLPLVRARALVLEGSGDPFSFPEMGRIVAALPGCKTAVIEGGGVPLPEQCPEEFTSAVVDFLSTP